MVFSKKAWKTALLFQYRAVNRLDVNGRTWLAGSFLAVVTLALYWPVRHFDFVQLDDPGYVFENQTVSKGLTSWGVVWSVVDAHESNWHPVTWLSHMLDCQLFGLRPGAHHVVNALLHSANAVLLFLVLRALTGAFWRAAFVAALFAWHPLRVESVAWISERKDVLSGFFFMLTLRAYGAYVAKLEAAARTNSEGRTPINREQVPKAEGRPKPEIRTPKIAGNYSGSFSGLGLWALDFGLFSRVTHNASFSYIVALVFFALGLMSKPMLVTTPLVLLLLDYWPLRRWTFENQKSKIKNLLWEKAPFFLLSFAVGTITFFAQRQGGAVVPLKSEGPWLRIGYALVGGFGYVQKFFWPSPLGILYLRPGTFPVGTLALALLILLGMTVAALAVVRRRPYLAVGWFWFLLMLLPVSGLIQVGPQFMADRYSYLPGIGLAVMLAWGGEEIIARLANAKVSEAIITGFAVAALITCLTLTRHQLGYWQNTETLMGHALELNPNNYLAHNNLGIYYTRLGRTEEASFHYRRARESDPVK